MQRTIMLALLLSVAPLPAFAQSTSTSGSNSGANSGSASNAVSNPTNSANNNIGTSTSTSGSDATAVSGSRSDSTSNGNQQGQGQMQGQGQSANNSQGQMQGQNTTTSSSQDAHNSQGQMQGQTTSTQASQANGQNVNLSFNSTTPNHLQVKTNTPVGLAASSSFSSDYCGGTVSGGASAAPLGISIGGSGPKYDKSCQALRRAEKFGMAAANAQNMGQPDLAGKLMTMMIWSICTSDSGGPAIEYPTASACQMAGLMGSMPARMSDAATPSAPPPVAQRVQSASVRDEKGKVTPAAASRADSGEMKVIASK